VEFQLLAKIFDLFGEWVVRWEMDKIGRTTDNDPFLDLIFELHRSNYLLWNEEDKVRRTDLDGKTIVSVKRGIDKLNQQRNDTIEHIDEWMLNNYYYHLIDQGLPIRSETPGSVFDRLSVLALKIYHMGKQTERGDVDQSHIDVCKKKLGILQSQQKDLLRALSEMISELNAGKIRMKVYRQFKMYNDPNLNPQIYGSIKPTEESKK